MTKTTTCANLGVGLVNEGKKVLLVDCDPQASLTISLGVERPDTLPFTITDYIKQVIMDKPLPPVKEGILHHAEGVDILPASIELAGMEASLVNVMSRETILRQILQEIGKPYDFILLDCMPSLGMLTINALAAANSVLIPVQAHSLSIRAAEISVEGKSIYTHDPKGKVAAAYRELTREVIHNERKRQKNKSDPLR